MRRRLGVLGVVLVVLVVAGCGSDASDDTGAAPSTTAAQGITGDGGGGGAPSPTSTLTEVPDRDPDAVGTLVEHRGSFSLAQDGGDGYYDKATLQPLDAALLQDAAGHTLSAGDLSDGDSVQVWFTGPCGES